jgi:hypothetical protein
MKWATYYAEKGGYDCMTDAIFIVDENRTVVATVDLSQYGQARCQPPPVDAVERAWKAANMLAAAPAMLEILKNVLEACGDEGPNSLNHVLYRQVQQRGAEIIAQIEKRS